MQNKRDIALETLGESYSRKFQERIRQLDRLKGVFVEDNNINGVKARHLIMYKLVCDEEGHTELRSQDGNRAYEFLVEFDLEDVAYGIYYGCRGLIKGGKKEEQIGMLQAEWDELLSAEVCNLLNNTFLDKDFSHRFQKTNNADRGTYWPFWLSLNEDEDVIEVAARAVRLTFNVYKRYLVDGILPETRKVVPKTVNVRTRYTQEAFDQTLSTLASEGRQQVFDGAKARAVLRRFIRRAMVEARNCKPGLVEDPRYEKCWRFYRISNVQAGFLLTELAGRMGVPVGKKMSWHLFTDIFLSAKGEPLESLRQLYAQSKGKKGDNYRDWAKLYLDRILL